ncbi:MAG TPA: LuxR C-terminal-related transcriptional regulator, partial [Ornithinibacter sp.]|nr:LuxR C-terminal-related transcriptional regulator [Ornithinibacter sp.]
REREVLDLLAAGRRTAASAEALCGSPTTVSNHLTSIFTKLEVADRASAMIRAREQGLGQPR